MMWAYILKLVVLLPLVCGLMVGCLFLWRRLEARMPGQPATRMLRVAETMMVSPGTRLADLLLKGLGGAGVHGRRLAEVLERDAHLQQLVDGVVADVEPSAVVVACHDVRPLCVICAVDLTYDIADVDRELDSITIWLLDVAVQVRFHGAIGCCSIRLHFREKPISCCADASSARVLGRERVSCAETHKHRNCVLNSRWIYFS